jgi:hypothetical protein
VVITTLGRQSVRRTPVVAWSVVSSEYCTTVYSSELVHFISRSILFYLVVNITLVFCLFYAVIYVFCLFYAVYDMLLYLT